MQFSNISLVITFVLAVATVWLGVNRWTLKVDSNWPLVYYALLVVYSNYYPNLINPYVIYVAVICGLLLRFEFLNDRLILFVRVIEALCFLHIGWKLFAALLAFFTS